MSFPSGAYTFHAFKCTKFDGRFRHDFGNIDAISYAMVNDSTSKLG